MKNVMKKLVGVTALSLLGMTAHAATLSAMPSANAVNVGDTFSVVIHVADLVDSGAPSLGAFDFDVQFDAGLVSYSGFTWGDSVLGDQLDLLGFGGNPSGYDVSSAALGALNFYEVSYDEVADLNALQAGEFNLLTLTFSALANGISPLTLSINSLSDADGYDLSAQINNGSVAVSEVPLPAALPLFVSALLLSAGRVRHRK